MKFNRPYSIDVIFSKINNTYYKSLLNIYKKYLILTKFDNIVKNVLPISLRPWCRVINYYNNILVLETVSANWKIRLHYEKLKLIYELKKNFLPLILNIKIKINPNIFKKNM